MSLWIINRLPAAISAVSMTRIPPIIKKIIPKDTIATPVSLESILGGCREKLSYYLTRSVDLSRIICQLFEQKLGLSRFLQWIANVTPSSAPLHPLLLYKTFLLDSHPYHTNPLSLTKEDSSRQTLPGVVHIQPLLHDVKCRRLGLQNHMALCLIYTSSHSGLVIGTTAGHLIHMEGRFPHNYWRRPQSTPVLDAAFRTTPRRISSLNTKNSLTRHNPYCSLFHQFEDFINLDSPLCELLFHLFQLLYRQYPRQDMCKSNDLFLPVYTSPFLPVYTSPYQV